MYKAIIFDVDGTLIDTEKAVLLSLQQTLSTAHGKQFELKDLHFALGIPGVNALLQLGIEESEINNSIDLWNQYMVEYQHEIGVFSGITETLSALKNMNIPLGIVTSKTKDEIVQDFDPLGISHFFHIAISADDTEQHKPHPAPLHKYLEKSGFEPQDVLYIGDTIYDEQCARDAGIDFATALWGAKDPSNMSAIFSFSRPEQLLAILECQLGLNDLKSHEIIAFQKHMNWNIDPVQQWDLALKQSLLTVAIRRNARTVNCENQTSELIGMARLLGDGCIYWYVNDVFVREDFQGFGLGKYVMGILLGHIKSHSLPGTEVSVNLMCAKGKEGFYRKFGFLERPHGHEGAGMELELEIK